MGSKELVVMVRLVVIIVMQELSELMAGVKSIIVVVMLSLEVVEAVVVKVKVEEVAQKESLINSVIIDQRIISLSLQLFETEGRKSAQPFYLRYNEPQWRVLSTSELD